MTDDRRMTMSHGLFLLLLSLGMGTLLTTGCTTTHTRGDSSDTWESPARFERDETLEDDVVLFRLRDHRNHSSATVYRFTPAFPNFLLPYIVAHRLGIDSESPDFHADAVEQGWIIRSDAPDTTLRVHAFNQRGERSEEDWTYFVVVGSEARSFEKNEALFTRLRLGFSPQVLSNGQATTTDHTAPNLAAGLSQPIEIALHPIDASGNPRRATIQNIGFPQWLTSGQILRESLTIEITPQTYLDILLHRLTITDAHRFAPPQCPDTCLIATWESTTDDSPSNQITAVLVRDMVAFQIHLRTPLNASEQLQDVQHEWISEVLADPESFFDDIDPLQVDEGATP